MRALLAGHHARCNVQPPRAQGNGAKPTFVHARSAAHTLGLRLRCNISAAAHRRQQQQQQNHIARFKQGTGELLIEEDQEYVRLTYDCTEVKKLARLGVNAAGGSTLLPACCCVFCWFLACSCWTCTAGNHTCSVTSPRHMTTCCQLPWLRVTVLMWKLAGRSCWILSRRKLFIMKGRCSQLTEASTSLLSCCPARSPTLHRYDHSAGQCMQIDVSASGSWICLQH